MADVVALSRRVIKTIQDRKLKFNQCQRELLAKTFSHFLDDLESTFRKDHTKDDCLRMCAKALSELWRVMTQADLMVATWGEEDWWRTAMSSSVAASLQMRMNLLLQDFIRCLDIAKIAIAEATRDQSFKLPIMDYAQFFTAIVEEAHQTDAQSFERDVEAIKKDKSFVQRKFGSSYGLSKYLLRKFHPETLSIETRRHYLLDLHYLEMTKTTLGSGSLGTVFECKCFGMPVVAKCLTFSARETDQSILETQVGALAKLQHVNLVQFIGYTVHEVQHLHYLVTERGSESLTTYLTRHGAKPLPHLKAFDILLQIAEGMKYLHKQNVVHGELHGNNILIDATERKKDGFWSVQVKLSDYGLAKVRQSVTSYTANPTSWRAPEIYEDRSESMDSVYTKPADVYSFAMTMYEILTGCKPLDGLSARDVVPSLVGGWRPEVDAKANCPGYLAAFMQRCWASNAQDRPLFSEVCEMLSYCRGVILRHSFPSPLSCINEYDAEVLSSHLGSKWCIQEGARGKLPVEVYSYAVFDVACRIPRVGMKSPVSRVDEVEEVMKAGRHFGNWASQACDLEKAFKLFRAVSDNHPEASWRLGLCYEIGMGVGASEIKAMALYEQARDLDFPSAYIDIGLCHAAGHGVARSVELAKKNWATALVHQTKTGLPVLSVQELVRNLSVGTKGCTLDSDRVYTTMASRLKELSRHDVGRALLTGPDSRNAPMLKKIRYLLAPSVIDRPSPANPFPDSNLKHVLAEKVLSIPQPPVQPPPPPTVQNPPSPLRELQNPPPPMLQPPVPPPPEPVRLQQQQRQAPRIVLLKGAGDQYRLKRRSSAHSSNSVILVIIAALLFLIAAILVKCLHNNMGSQPRSTRFQCRIRID